MLAESYHSGLVERIKADDFTYRAGRLTVHLAREFGFCYGVDRAVDYAYQTRRRFPDRAVYLTGEIIHNPHVNDQLRAMDVRFLSDTPGAIDHLASDDVVILPAFGVTMSMLQQLERRGCTLIDTTCGSVLNVWKNVRRYAEGGYTSVIHGKVWHEETQATASQAVEHGGRYLVLFNDAEAEVVCDLHSARRRPAPRCSRAFPTRCPGFDPARDLQRVGLANQTTMLMSESLEIEKMLKAAMIDRYGEDRLGPAFSGVRHHLQRHPGPAGRGGRAAARDAHRFDDRHRRVQQQQHLQPGADLRGLAADVSHRRSRLPGVARRDPPSAGGDEDRSDELGVVAVGGPISIGLTSGRPPPTIWWGMWC